LLFRDELSLASEEIFEFASSRLGSSFFTHTHLYYCFCVREGDAVALPNLPAEVFSTRRQENEAKNARKGKLLRRTMPFQATATRSNVFT
jgi:hypothetical protein